MTSRAGIEVEASERQWRGQECVCVDAEKCASLMLNDEGEREGGREQLMRKATCYHQNSNCFIVVTLDGNEVMELISSNT